MFEFVPAHANAECESAGATWVSRSSSFSPPESSLVMCEPNSFEMLREDCLPVAGLRRVPQKWR